MSKILLIEDDLPLLRMYQVAFRKAGIEIINAIDGEEGLEKARREVPDLILLDLVLPKKDGFEVLKELKADPKLSKTPTVCLSVLHQEEDKEKCRNLGADGYMVKNEVSPDEIVKNVISKLS